MLVLGVRSCQLGLLVSIVRGSYSKSHSSIEHSRIGTTVRIALTGIGADTMIPPLMARRTTLISDFMSIEQWFGMTHLVLCEENS